MLVSTTNSNFIDFTTASTESLKHVCKHTVCSVTCF